MELGKVFQCLEMGVTGGILSRKELNEVKGLLENNENGGESMLTRKEAAKLVKTHLNSLDRYARNGVIKKFHTPFGPRFDRNELIEKLTMTADQSASI